MVTAQKRKTSSLTKAAKASRDGKWVSTICTQCNMGPDPIRVRVVDGKAVEITGNPALEAHTPSRGQHCVKALGLIQKLYNPVRIKGPMKRTNPKKGPGEDPGWVEISWDEALDLVAQKFKEVRQKGILDEQGLPRVAITQGNPGTQLNQGTWEAFWQAWGKVDPSLGSGGGVKCYHSEHIYGEMWHKAFICAGDVPLCKYELVFGRSTNASQPPATICREAEARSSGTKSIQIEPHLSQTGAKADEWIPIKPKTDAAFLLGMLHTMLHEIKSWDLPFLKNMTGSPYLVGPHGYFVRDPTSKKPLLWDLEEGKAKTCDTPDIKEAALEGAFRANGVQAKPAFQLLLEHMRAYTPEWAAQICDVPATKIRKIARDFVENARIGDTIDIEGMKLPYRPVSINLGKSVNNGFGSYLTVWASHIISMLVGGIEVPGGHCAVYSRLQPGPLKPGEDSFPYVSVHPLDTNKWQWPPDSRDGLTTLCPISVSMGPSHLTYRNMVDPPPNWPRPSVPDIWVTFIGNPLVSQWDHDAMVKAISQIPFYVAFSYTLNETNHYADVLLPDNTNLESMQLCAMGDKKSARGWYSSGYHLRQPVVEPPYNTRDITDIFTDLAERTGILREYNQAINNGAGTRIRLQGEASLQPDRKYSAEEIYRKICLTVTEGQMDWDEIREKGFFLKPRSRLADYLYPQMKKLGLRFELPYQERLKRIGEQLKERLHEKDIQWWDRQCKQYEPLPHWQDVPSMYDSLPSAFGRDPQDYPFWLLCCRTPLFAWGSNASVPVLLEVAEQMLGHAGVVINRKTAQTLGIKNNDIIWIESPIGKVKGRAILREGVRPEVLVTTQQFGNWLTPLAKDKAHLWSNMNPITPILHEMTDETGGASDHVKVKVYKAE